MAEAEQFRYENKLYEIFNFEEFIKTVESDLYLATKKNTVINFDSYFFETQKKVSKSPINYIIADLDHIRTFTNVREDELFKENMSEFHRALRRFLKYFLTPSKREV